MPSAADAATTFATVSSAAASYDRRFAQIAVTRRRASRWVNRLKSDGYNDATAAPWAPHVRRKAIPSASNRTPAAAAIAWVCSSSFSSASVASPRPRRAKTRARVARQEA